MPRSIALFKKQKMHPVPAPTDHWIQKATSSPSRFFPNAMNIKKAEKVIKEYLGLIWAKLRGQI